MRFAEFSVGQVIEAGPITVSEEEIIEFATRFDPQWFHVDPQRCAQSGWGRVIASGWHTCSIAMRLGCDAALNDSESFASPGLAYLRWPNAVRGGDQLRLRADVLEVRRSQSKPNLGILRWRWRLLNQAQQEVLDLEATSLFDLAGQ